MERQGNRLVGLVENLLTTSRLESDQLSISIGRVLFEDLCRETVEGLGTDADRVVTDVPDDIPVLHTDRQLLSRVITNLLDNALKYSPEGSMCELGARADGDQLVFWVRDHGIGIEPEQMERIFERFYQVDSSSTRRFSGAGLGLSMVHDLVQHLGGTVTWRARLITAARSVTCRSRRRTRRPPPANVGRADIAIVGGGIIGAACAYELSRAGASVTLIERDELAAGASGRNQGWFVPRRDACSSRWRAPRPHVS
jgi:light-regulated signal transduction histidine kinase (bacteriophytochrome)